MNTPLESGPPQKEEVAHSPRGNSMELQGKEEPLTD
jgi:hypothetical protein